MNLGNNTVLITGGGSGIGLSLASHFVQNGSTVIICGRNKNKLEEAKLKHPPITTYVCDVGKPDERISMFKWISNEFPTLNILVNNAGIQRRGLQLMQEQAWDTLSEEIKINLEAPIHLSMLFIPQLIKQENPAIVNVTSSLAFVPLSIAPIYSATKAALHSFTLSLRQQLIDTPISVLEIIPPAVNTDLGGKGLHTFGVDVDEFTNAIVHQLKSGQIEAAYGAATESSQASREQIDLIFKRMNQRK
ncbi:MAG: SDR family NAD(P)-dependent oxidoreductase [Anaerolineales bacterium]|nr:MAG: SDR family NAD(P)-dependent oxidoreductase [Anaerolineales bacterium]